MSDKKEMVPADEARKAVQDMSYRVGLLHMCYARAIVEALGEEKGIELIKKAIWDYGTKTGERTKEKVIAQGYEPTLQNMGKASDLSPIGWDFESVVVDGERRTRSYDCAIARAWRDYGEEKLGGLYCLVDPSKMQAYDPNFTMVHVKKITEGDEYCEIAIRPKETT